MNKDDHKIHSEVVSSYLEVECIILIYRCIDIMICNIYNERTKAVWFGGEQLILKLKNIKTANKY